MSVQPGNVPSRSVMIGVNDARATLWHGGIKGPALRQALIRCCNSFGVTLAIVPSEGTSEAALMEFAGWQIRIVDHRGIDCDLQSDALPVAQLLCTKAGATDEDVDLLRHTLCTRRLRPGERRLEGDTFREGLRLDIQASGGLISLQGVWDHTAPENQGNPATTE